MKSADGSALPPVSRPAFEEMHRTYWHVIAGWSFHDDECPAGDSDEATCNCGYHEALQKVHDLYGRAALRAGHQGEPPTKCPVCTSDKVAVEAGEARHVFGETVAFPDEFSRCTGCGEEFYTSEQSRAHTNAFRKACRGTATP